MLRRAVCLLVLCALTFMGCASGNEETPSRRPPLDPEKVSKLVKSHMKLEVDGDVAFTYDKDIKLRIVTIDEPGLEQVRFLSVGIEEFQELDERKRFRFAFDLVGVYDGPGTYELPKAGGEATAEPGAAAEEAAESVASGLSKPILIYYELNPGATTPGPDSVKNASQFENAIEPCELKVGENARFGMLDCPEVADSVGKTVSIDMRWEQVS